VFDAPVGGGEAGSTASPAAGAGAGANPRLALAAMAGALAVGGLAVVIAMSGSAGAVIDGPAASAPGAASSGPVAVGGEIVVDVSGAVVTPGLYRLATGARIGDAIDAAGGFSPRVDAERVGLELNLATTLTDGAQVHVPSRDDPARGAGAGPSPGAGGAGGGQLVNLNTATEAELDGLSGIGPVTAGKIIESRATAPFTTVDELRERGLVGQKTFDKIRAQLTVG
jgi:competence protein ComEA